VSLASFIGGNAFASKVRINRNEPTKVEYGSIISSEINHPDIYDVIPDDYGVKDVLRELYGIANQPFVDFLEHKGFMWQGTARQIMAQPNRRCFLRKILIMWISY
jgi:hypothetical protein